MSSTYVSDKSVRQLEGSLLFKLGWDTVDESLGHLSLKRNAVLVRHGLPLPFTKLVEWKIER